jgi:maltose alpha-D-glucosyltransferase/alpha-amylase
VRPVISDPTYGYQRVNVEAQRRDPHSLLNWMERKIRMRRECPEISWGDWRIVSSDPGILAIRYEYGGHALLIVHNFNDGPRAIGIDPRTADAPVLVDLLATNDSHANANGRHVFELDAYGYRWFRVGGRDRAVPR